MRIHQALRSGGFPNATTLARELEVCTKSINRDLAFMRDRLKLPIEYDSTRFGFFYAQEVREFPALHITQGELVALVVAEKALRQYRGTSFEQPLLSALRKMEQSLPDFLSLSLDDIAQTISFRTRAEPVLDLGVFDALAQATAARRQLELTYRKPGQPHPEQRVVDPYHLANINGEWYLFAFDHLRKDLRTFVPARIKAVRPTGKTFDRLRDFSLDQRLRRSFGVQTGQGEYDVAIRFHPNVADYIREKQWHESQQLRELKSGGVELRLKLSSLAEIGRWVLSWGGDACIVRPAELRQFVEQAARQILRAVRAD